MPFVLVIYCVFTSLLFSENKIDGAPVIKEGKVVGVFTSTDLINALANNMEDIVVGDLMSKEVIIINKVKVTPTQIML